MKIFWVCSEVVDTGRQGGPGRLGVQGTSVDCLGSLPALKQQELQIPGWRAAWKAAQQLTCHLLPSGFLSTAPGPITNTGTI